MFFIYILIKMATTSAISQNEKRLFLDRLNEDHAEHLQEVVQAFSPDLGAIQSVAALDFDAKEVQLRINHTQTINLPLLITGAPQEQFFYLVQLARLKLGKQPGKIQYAFTLLAQEKLTAHFYRLHVASDLEISLQAGAAARLVLEDLLAAPNKNIGDLLAQIPRQESERRQQTYQKIYRQGRYLTLHRAHREKEKYLAHIDVFTHGETALQQWLSELQDGQFLYSNAVVDEHTAHLAQGRALLIADETAYPALDDILKTWQNPTPPKIVLLAQEKDNLTYFSDVFMQQWRPQTLCAHVTEQSEQLPKLINTYAIDALWSATASSVATALRNAPLCQQLSSKQRRIRVYWQA